MARRKNHKPKDEEAKPVTPLIQVIKDLDSLQYLPVTSPMKEDNWIKQNKVSVTYDGLNYLKLEGGINPVYFFDHLEGEWAYFSRRTDLNGLCYIRIPATEYRYLVTTYQTYKAISTNNGKKKKGRAVV